MESNTFLQVLILYGIERLNGQRSSSGLLNILVGKKNHQTWSDIHYFSLTLLYKFLPKELCHQFEENVLELLHKKLIIQVSEGIYLITERGKRVLNEHYVILTKNGIRDGRIIDKMKRYWMSVHLLVQTLSCLNHGDKHFLPIIRDYSIQLWVKEWVKRYGLIKGTLGLHQEWKEILLRLSPDHRELALERLSGYHRTAYTIQQIARIKGVNTLQMEWEWQVFLSEFHTILQSQKLSFLPEIEIESQKLLSASSQQTLRLLKQGRTIEEISQIRNLKSSTVMDHIVEIALIVPDFQPFPYVSQEEIRQVSLATKHQNSLRLSTIKQDIPNLSYFQIRLALAILRKGDNDEIDESGKYA